MNPALDPVSVDLVCVRSPTAARLSHQSYRLHSYTQPSPRRVSTAQGSARLRAYTEFLVGQKVGQGDIIFAKVGFGTKMFGPK